MIDAPDQERPARAIRWRQRSALLAFGLLALVAAAGSGAAAAAPQPLQTAIVDPELFTGPNADAGLVRAAAAGATAIKVPLFWNEVAPARPPSGFRPANASDPAYDWSQLDAELGLIRVNGLEPIVYIAGAPDWALTTVDGFRRPSPSEYAAFVQAAVERYSGTTAGLPRVRYWQAWNEPNKVPGPAAKAGVEDWYRTLVNGFAARVHSVPGNAVVAGGLSPFGISTAVAPLTFMRDLLCLTAGGTPRPLCPAPIHFDIWSVDPYTAGGPSHRTARADDISIAELPEMKSLLDAAVRSGRVVTTQPVRFWVTEFAWDTNPPNPGGVPIALDARWVADALHRMWQAGVSLVTWYTLRDQPLRASPYQSGLYFRGPSFAADRPKPALTAFRFPFVAYPDSGQISVWGRTPTSGPGPVMIEQKDRTAWKPLATVSADAEGIFTGTLTSRGLGPLRAVFAPAHTTSLAFSLVSPPDQVYQPFGAQLAGGSGSGSGASAVGEYVESAPDAGGATAAGLVLPARLATGRGAVAPAVPGSMLGAVADAIDQGDRSRALALAGALAAVTALLALTAIRRRRPGETQA